MKECKELKAEFETFRHIKRKQEECFNKRSEDANRCAKKNVKKKGNR